MDVLNISHRIYFSYDLQVSFYNLSPLVLAGDLEGHTPAVHRVDLQVLVALHDEIL